jgi:hypothetical protein
MTEKFPQENFLSWLCVFLQLFKSMTTLIFDLIIYSVSSLWMVSRNFISCFEFYFKNNSMIVTSQGISFNFPSYINYLYFITHLIISFDETERTNLLQDLSKFSILLGKNVANILILSRIIIYLLLSRELYQQQYFQWKIYWTR